MKAIVFDRYGSADVLELRDLEIPDVGDDGVLVRVEAASLNPYDWHLMTGLPYVVRPKELGLRPKVSGIGADLAGRVEAVGQNVTGVRPGDDVYGRVDTLPGTKLLALGSVAEYVRVSVDSIRPRPACLTAEEAAAVPLAATTALWGLHDVGRLQPGVRVVINGASGGVGTFAVQIAKAAGAEVTGVCSARNVDLVRSIGADHVIDYTREDPTRGARRFDLVLDNVGNHPPGAWRRVMAPTATYVASFGQPEHLWFGPFARLLRMFVVAPFISQRMTLLQPQRRDEDLDRLSALIESGNVTPVIDRTYPLADTRAAMEYLAQGHARGKVVITI
ncbi:MAG TPA: NAD(P)-dependent alcohol dehydrogenase [Nitriliruptorales bacterium]|nr:NAD(P)-dependent alcohol dehydrogenase [Nitriliruptorales bacterium]